MVGPEVDIWALGICLYKMAVAYSPDQVRGYRYGKKKLPLFLIFPFRWRPYSIHKKRLEEN